ncbi:MAG: dihydrofolate reductase family protein [Acidobacteriota bacterium]|nr:dihydrofolate reductase family protein [Acidobacteriota bacterium]
MRRVSRARPFIVCNLASSVDGKIDSVMREGGGFSSREDRDRLDALRAEVDALVVGAETIRTEDPPLSIRAEQRRRRRVDEGREEQLRVIVLSRSGRMPAGARFLGGPAARRWLAVPEGLEASALAPLDEVIRRGDLEIVSAGRDGVDLHALVARLADDGCKKIVVEGGGEVVAAFLEAGLIDEVRITLAPVLIGGREAPTPVGGDGWTIAESKRLELVAHERIGDELYLRYRVL